MLVFFYPFGNNLFNTLINISFLRLGIKKGKKPKFLPSNLDIKFIGI